MVINGALSENGEVTTGADNKARCLLPQAIFLILILFSNCSEKVSLNSLLEEMADRKGISYVPSDRYSLKQFSSYNRSSLSPTADGWYANNDMSHFLRVEVNQGRREFVLFDAEGPGAIVRWWMTFYKAQQGVLRVYLDGDSIPVIQGAPDVVLSGTLLAEYPFAASVQEGAARGGEGRDYDHNLYLPIPFARHAKITYECDAIDMKYELDGDPVDEGYYWPDVFYNICYREYDRQTKVESFSASALEEAVPLMRTIKNKLLNEPICSSDESEFADRLLPGDSLIIPFQGQASALEKLSLELTAPDLPQALRSTVISANFDSMQTIWAPIGDFFGTGYLLSSHKTWMNQTTEDGLLQSNWVMPFQHTCQIIFINYGTDTITLKGSACFSNYEWQSNSMYFGASWHEYRNIRTRDDHGSPFDINFVEINGQGVYVGDQVTLFNNTYHWWGEGDEKIFVDGEPFPSSFGTGTEDYYGYSFGRPESFSHPFLSQPVGKGNTDWGLTVNMRHRSLDAIPFTSSISSNIELWHWADIRMNYALTTYWYAKLPFNVNIRPDIESVRFPVVRSKEDFNSLY